MAERSTDKTSDRTSVVDHDWRFLRGFSDVIARVADADNKGRLAPVMLLDGRDGIGKRLLAAALAAMPFCERGTACGECSTCRAVAQEIHPEVLWMDAVGATIKNDDVEAIQEHLALAPMTMSGTSAHGGARRARVVVVIDADRMGVAAANRMLKTLEEPPPWGRVILTTSRATSMLPTILSRCARWKLRPPSAADGEAVLMRLTDEAGMAPVPVDTMQRALRGSGYSVGGAWKLLGVWQGGSQGMRGFAERLLSARSADQVMRVAEELKAVRDIETSGRRKAFALAQELEIILNENYRSLLAQGHSRSVSPAALRSLRSLLGETRRLAGRGQIELNIQLFAETAGLRALQARIR